MLLLAAGCWLLLAAAAAGCWLLAGCCLPLLLLAAELLFRYHEFDVDARRSCDGSTVMHLINHLCHEHKKRPASSAFVAGAVAVPMVERIRKLLLG